MEDKFKPDIKYLKEEEPLKVEVKQEEEVTTTMTFPVLSLDEDLNEKFIKIKLSQLKKIRNKIFPYTQKKFNYTDLLLGLFTTLIGVIIGALLSELSLNEWKGKLTYIVLPILAAISGTSYFFIKHINQKNVSELAKEVLENIPDTEQISKSEKS
jgi:hypothetical protein